MPVFHHSLCLPLLATGLAVVTGHGVAEAPPGEEDDKCGGAEIQFEDDPGMTRAERLQAMDAAYYEAIRRAGLCIGAAGGSAGGSSGAGQTAGASPGAAQAGTPGASAESAESPKAGSSAAQAEAPKASSSAQAAASPEPPQAPEASESPETSPGAESAENSVAREAQDANAWSGVDFPGVPESKNEATALQGDYDSVPSAGLSGTDAPEPLSELLREAEEKAMAPSMEREGAVKKSVPRAGWLPRRGAPGPGRAPEDIPPADNDDALAQQIRAAAEMETDPQKRARLWNEYRKYKNLPPKS